MASSTIFWVFGMTLPGIEPPSPGPMVNTLQKKLKQHINVQLSAEDSDPKTV